MRTTEPGAEADTRDISPGSRRVRCTVVRVDQPRGMQVGDWFEVRGSLLVIPEGKTITPSALAAVAPVIAMRQEDLPADSWLARKPFLCGSDAKENLIMKIEALPLEGGGA